MRKNLIIVTLIISLGVSMLWKSDSIDKEYDELSKQELSTGVGDIVTNFDYKTFSLFTVEQMVFRINHKTGLTHYFNQGIWVPVQDLETLQKMAIERQKYEERLRQEAQKEKLLNEFD